VLIDFGSAHQRDPDGVETHQIGENTLNVRNGVYRICATKYYDPPDLNFSPARDIYALGHLLRDCFEKDVPFEWSLIINKCISWQPKYRYQTASELWNDVHDIEKIKRKIYWGLRKKKIEEQREVERSLANAEQKDAKWEEILSVDQELTTPDLTVMRIKLTREPAVCFAVEEPLILGENTVLLVSGRGVLRADISGPSSSIVVLRDYASLNNINKEFPPDNELLYAIIGPGAYLNFPNIAQDERQRFFLDNGRRRIFRDLDATTALRFEGPDTFSGIEQQSIDGLEESALPVRYRSQLIGFFRGEKFSVIPEKV
jgi:serine/threonine protein kinase